MPTISAESVEYAIQFPAPGQVDSLLDFKWLVPHVDGGWWGDGSDPLFPTYYLFTTPERMEPLREENQRGKEFEEKPYPLTTPVGWNLVRPRPFQSAIERCELVPIPGREIFARIAATDDYHQILINSGCGTYNEPHRRGPGCAKCARNSRGFSPSSALDPQARRISAAYSSPRFSRCARMIGSCTSGM